MKLPTWDGNFLRLGREIKFVLMERPQQFFHVINRYANSNCAKIFLIKITNKLILFIYCIFKITGIGGYFCE